MNGDKKSTEKIDVSFLILTYNSNINKLFTTINSILVQQFIDYQIVVSDDGSDSFDKELIERYLSKNNVNNFIITSMQQNMGTVYNIANGLSYCCGEYVKFLSPGDYLYGKMIAKDWLECIKKNDAVVCFGECIHYLYQEGRLIPISVHSNPQRNDNFYRGSWEYNYLIFDDPCTGSCVLAKTDIVKKYVDVILGKVKYTEDNIYRIMAFNSERACYLKKESLLYENGTGISTSQNIKWLEIIKNEWKVSDDIMLSMTGKDKFLVKNFKKKVSQYREENKMLRRVKYLQINGSLLNKVISLKERKTGTTIDQDYVELIHCFDKKIQ